MMEDGGLEESKIARAPQQQQQVIANSSTTPSENQLPYAIIEGPEPSQDLSYKWVAKYENVAEIEKGVPLPEF